MRKLTFSTLIAVVLSLLAMPAMATSVQRWQENAPFSVIPLATGFDLIEMFALSGDGFAAPGVSNISATGWVGSLVNPNYTTMGGSEVNWIQWDQTYLTANYGTYDFLAWQSGRVVDAAHISGSVGGWIVTPFSNDNWEGYDRSAVPEPLTLFLTGVGLVGLGLTKRWRKTQASG